MKLMWLGYLIYSLGNCAMKLCIEIETDLITAVNGQQKKTILPTVIECIKWR